MTPRLTKSGDTRKYKRMTRSAYEISTAGQFFQVTNGGGPMNSNDALIAWARKDMARKAKEMRAKKATIMDFCNKTANVALALLNNPRKPMDWWKTKWTIADIKLMIKFKHGPSSDDNKGLSGLSITNLWELYKANYLNLPFPSQDQYEWTDAMEAELQKLEGDAPENILLDAALSQAIARDNEFLTT
jgi:hypothetical protein